MLSKQITLALGMAFCLISTISWSQQLEKRWEEVYSGKDIGSFSFNYLELANFEDSFVTNIKIMTKVSKYAAGILTIQADPN